MKTLRKYAPVLALGLLVLAAVDPALAQIGGGGGGGGDIPFRGGLRTLLNWIFYGGAFLAVACFVWACGSLMARNLMQFASGVLGVVIGGALMGNAERLVQ